MRLNTLKPAANAKKAITRVGRGIGSGKGKTCGRGHKGQTSRTGYGRKIGFEGGQMPLQRRVPKFGFKSRVSSITAEVRLSELNKVTADVVNIDALKNANIIQSNIKRAKIMLSGKLEKPVNIKGLKVTAGAKEAIEKAGGKVE